MFVDKIIKYISSSSPLGLILYATIFVLFGSIPTVYLLSYFDGVEYTSFLLGISIFLPLMLTPIVISILLRLITNLKYFKEHLKEEVEKNKAKDIMMFEQARFVLMGEMLANISHQWKQPLNTINLATLNLKMASLQEKKADKEERYFHIIEDNVNYLASTIDDFMSFFDKRNSKEIQNLCFIINEVKSVISTHIQNKKISLEIKCNFGCENIEIASSISQVLLNLLNNSKDALSTIDGDKKIVLEFFKKDKVLQIVTSDNGKGIDKEIIAKVFNPYFTTKAKKQGTGIGLYMSKQIIHKVFDGDIKVMDDSKKTSFKIEIPYSDKCIVKG